MAQKNYSSQIDQLVDEITDFLNSHAIIFVFQQEIYETLSLCAELTAEYDESHDVRHHIDVYKNAVKNFIELDADIAKNFRLFELITYASLLHDTIDHKYKNDLENKTTKLNVFLEEHFKSFDTDIKWIIDNISYSKEVKNGYPLNANKIVQIARDIVSDADKLEAIGQIGIDRCKQFTSAFNPTASDNEIIQLVVFHCHEKLLKLKDSFFRTESGKKMAESAHKIVEKFVEDNSKNT